MNDPKKPKKVNVEVPTTRAVIGWHINLFSSQGWFIRGETDISENFMLLFFRAKLSYKFSQFWSILELMLNSRDVRHCFTL